MQFFSAIKQKIVLYKNYFAEKKEQELTDKFNQLNLFFLNLTRPKNFRSTDKDNCIVLLDNNFEALCAIMESNGAFNPKKFTLFEFYGRLRYYKSLNKPSQK